MIKLHKKTKGSVIASKKVNKAEVSRWGILSIKNKRKNYFQISDVVEKPSVRNAPSNFAIIGRYILPSKIFGEIKTLKPGSGGEIHITDAIKKLIKKNYNLFKIKEIKKDIISLGAKKIDYIVNYDIKSFKKIKRPNKKFNLFIAYYIQRTRLIDNI